MKKILSGLIAIALACSLSACKKDPDVIKIFMKKYIKQKNYFYEG